MCPANWGGEIAAPRGGGGGGVTHHTTCYAPAFKKSVERGSVFRYTASKGVVDVSPEKGVCFSSLSPFRGPISQSTGFEGF